ncbi:TPA: hypothetical protein ACGC57_003510, partial [Acinetobacter baumannii]
TRQSLKVKMSDYMFKKLIRFFIGKKTIVPKAIFDPMDFSHAISLQITIKKDGSKLYQPFGILSKKGTPITTIVYENDIV